MRCCESTRNSAIHVVLLSERAEPWFGADMSALTWLSDLMTPEDILDATEVTSPH